MRDVKQLCSRGNKQGAAVAIKINHAKILHHYYGEVRSKGSGQRI